MGCFYVYAVNDLLSPNNENLKIREDPQEGIVIAGVTEGMCLVHSPVLTGMRERKCSPMDHLHSRHLYHRMPTIPCMRFSDSCRLCCPACSVREQPRGGDEAAGAGSDAAGHQFDAHER